MKRLALALVSLAVFVLLSEGVLSLFLGRSWLGFVREKGWLSRLAEEGIQTDAERFRAAAETPGPYRVHEDPLVGYAFKAAAQVRYMDQALLTDELGLPLRPGPPAPAGAFRILVLGDSVAFGQGLAEDQRIAVQLERVLSAARAPSARPVACSTVAVPSWNCRNAARFLLDHLDVLDPDLVLYMDVPNDVEDSYGANESGQRRKLEDPGVPHPSLHFGLPYTYLKLAARELGEAGREVDEERCGPDVLAAGLCFSSAWRLADMADTLARLDERLRRVGARLALLPYEQHALHRQIAARLAESGRTVPSIPLLEELRAGDTQGADPHPSAETTRVFALWTAAALLERGWIPDGAALPLPAVEERWSARRGRELDGEELRTWSRAYEERLARELEPVISTETLQGMLQVYAGLNLDGTFGTGLLACLPRGNTLRVELAPLALRADLYPLAVRVHVNERELGELVLADQRAGAVSEDFPLPEEARERPYEVRLEARDWCVVTIRGQSLVSSARLVGLASLAE